jgi:hypothetical protein
LYSSTVYGTKCPGFQQKHSFHLYSPSLRKKIGNNFYSHEEARLGQALHVLSTKNAIYFTLKMIEHNNLICPVYNLYFNVAIPLSL